jgi:hypothetical protein
MSQELKTFNQIKPDFYNEEYIRQVFESGTKEQLSELADNHKLTPEQIKIFCYYAKLRREIIDGMKKAIDDRRQRDPLATDEEFSLGAYQESIEPQVREVVINLRRKGYSTYESGFGDFDGQIISFENDDLKDFYFSDEILDKFKERGVIIQTMPKEIRLLFRREFSQEEIKNFWQEVENLIPDLGRPAEPCRLNQAKHFRERQRLL